MPRGLDNFIVSPETSIRDTAAVIDRNGKGIALVADENRKLIATITDGDIRRAMIAGTDLAGRIGSLAEHRAQPVTAVHGASAHELRRLMNVHSVRHIPVLDSDGRIADIALLDELIAGEELELRAVIMAGGFGKRLLPLTEEMPKPMLPVGDKPLMEHIVNQLSRSGIRNISVATHFRADVISGHFGDGSAFGVSIDYVNEDKPLGTAGALGLMDTPSEPLLVINGDVLTNVDFREMLDFHRKHDAVLTVGVREYDVQVPYGVIDCECGRVVRIREKPVVGFKVNAGVYILEPCALEHVRPGERTDMTDLIERLAGADMNVAAYPIMDYWLDIGKHDDYCRANDDADNGRSCL